MSSLELSFACLKSEAGAIMNEDQQAFFDAVTSLLTLWNLKRLPHEFVDLFDFPTLQKARGVIEIVMTAKLDRAKRITP